MPIREMKFVAVAAAVLLASRLGIAAVDVASVCTDSEITILSSAPQTLPSEVADPILTDERRGVRLTVGAAHAVAIFAARKRESQRLVPAVEALEKRLLREHDSGQVATVNELQPAWDSIPRSELESAIARANEIHVLLLRSLRDGLASATVDGVRITNVTVQAYEAQDQAGKVNGVRIVAEGARLFDYCSIDPGK